MNELKQNDAVTFDLDETKKGITGKVCGKVGPVIIVELNPNQLKGYEFTHIYILDSQIVK